MGDDTEPRIDDGASVQIALVMQAQIAHLHALLMQSLGKEGRLQVRISDLQTQLIESLTEQKTLTDQLHAALAAQTSLTEQLNTAMEAQRTLNDRLHTACGVFMAQHGNPPPKE